jgi:hypothetical protein
MAIWQETYFIVSQSGRNLDDREYAKCFAIVQSILPPSRAILRECIQFGIADKNCVNMYQAGELFEVMVRVDSRSKWQIFLEHLWQKLRVENLFVSSGIDKQPFKTIDEVCVHFKSSRAYRILDDPNVLYESEH